MFYMSFFSFFMKGKVFPYKNKTRKYRGRKEKIQIPYSPTLKILLSFSVESAWVSNF